METKMAYGNSKLNRDVIKYIAMLTMLLNHISLGDEVKWDSCWDCL